MGSASNIINYLCLDPPFFKELENKNIEEAYILNKNLDKMIEALDELFDRYSSKSSVPI